MLLRLGGVNISLVVYTCIYTLGDYFMRAENRAGLGHMLTSTLTADKRYSADTCSWPIPGANIIRQRLHVYKEMRYIEGCSFRCDTPTW